MAPTSDSASTRARRAPVRGMFGCSQRTQSAPSASQLPRRRGIEDRSSWNRGYDVSRIEEQSRVEKSKMLPQLIWAQHPQPISAAMLRRTLKHSVEVLKDCVSVEVKCFQHRVSIVRMLPIEAIVK